MGLIITEPLPLSPAASLTGGAGKYCYKEQAYFFPVRLFV